MALNDKVQSPVQDGIDGSHGVSIQHSSLLHPHLLQECLGLEFLLNFQFQLLAYAPWNAMNDVLIIWIPVTPLGD